MTCVFRSPYLCSVCVHRVNVPHTIKYDVRIPFPPILRSHLHKLHKSTGYPYVQDWVWEGERMGELGKELGKDWLRGAGVGWCIPLMFAAGDVVDSAVSLLMF
jgi:hypothetical protein